MYTLGLYFYYQGIEIGGEVSILSPIQGSYSIITVFLAVLFLKETITFTKIIAILLILLGILFTSTDIRKLKHLRSKKGVSYAVYAMILMGLQFFIMGIVSKDITMFGFYSEPMDYISLYFFSTIINPTLFIILAVAKKQIPTMKEVKTKNIPLILIVTSIMFAIAWIALNYGLSFGQVSLLVPVSSLNPAITVLLAAKFYKEKLVLNQKLGILTILAGLFLISL